MDAPRHHWDDEIEIVLDAREARMSHWICSPRITHRPSGKVLLDLHQTDWDLTASVEQPDILQLHLRRYPGNRVPITLTVRRADLALQLADQLILPGQAHTALDAAWPKA
ncbi:MAG: hypothetical protein REJ50_18875 [Bordetella sp.]|nr:hypothetical protein [Bordetella sp.]